MRYGRFSQGKGIDQAIFGLVLDEALGTVTALAALRSRKARRARQAAKPSAAFGDFSCPSGAKAMPSCRHKRRTARRAVIKPDGKPPPGMTHWPTIRNRCKPGSVSGNGLKPV